MVCGHQGVDLNCELIKADFDAGRWDACDVQPLTDLIQENGLVILSCVLVQYVIKELFAAGCVELLDVHSFFMAICRAI